MSQGGLILAAGHVRSKKKNGKKEETVGPLSFYSGLKAAHPPLQNAFF